MSVPTYAYETFAENPLPGELCALVCAMTTIQGTVIEAGTLMFAMGDCCFLTRVGVLYVYDKTRVYLHVRD